MLSKMKLAFLDVETDGLEADARIIEIAIVGVDMATGETSNFASFVFGDGRAGPDWVHGITDADLQSAPSFEEVWGDVSRLISGRVIVSHNEVFDRRIVNSELQRLGKPELAKFFCTKNLAKTLGYARRKSGNDPGASGKLSDLASRLGLASRVTHRALADAETCRDLFEYFLEHHPSDVEFALSQVSAVKEMEDTSGLEVDRRKPAIIIVDSANINERRRGRQWFIEGIEREIQIWSYEHFFDFHKNLKLHVPDAIIICFFDESSMARCRTVDDESGLIYSFSRSPHDNLKLFKVPRDFSADDVIISLAKKLKAFIISGDHFVEQEDSDDWKRSEMQFYAQFPLSTQRWQFISKSDVDTKARERRTLAEVVSALNLRPATESESRQIATYADSFAENFYKNRDNVRGGTLRKRFWNTPRLSNQIVIGDIQLAEISRKSRESAVRARAYLFSLLRKYLKQDVTVIGRLRMANADLFLEWFRLYRPIKVIPSDPESFRERIESRQFVEVSGNLAESSGQLVLRDARIEKVLEFSDLVRSTVSESSQVSKYARIGRFKDPLTWKSLPELAPATLRQPVPVSLPVPVPDRPANVVDELTFDDFLNLGLPNPPRQRFGKRRIIVVAVVAVVVCTSVLIFGDLTQLFGSVESSAKLLVKMSAIHATFR